MAKPCGKKALSFAGKNSRLSEEAAPFAHCYSGQRKTGGADLYAERVQENVQMVFVAGLSL